ncbi:hypothetical protein DSO57_1023274 [Entomophthora muscae]|uniref:Uncharacterized protein n=2 Tax=Entomophthora muscae TaxID=34485 RepID=A0ACC2TBV5_9FUNG|nr:hypothetical protein DSO57_1030949 [Entomophthora muscae]KAJ9076742.1 hypothetical protein DSO57_1023274 [Entomophthora muscae]
MVLIGRDLLEFLDKLFPDGTLDSSKTILFPLCGQTLDMIYCLKDKGLNVIGIEGVESAIPPFFQNNSLIPYEKMLLSHPSTDDVQSEAIVYSFHQGLQSLKIVKQNYFETNYIPGMQGFPKVDAIFDRGSLTAIDPSLRSDYVKTIMHWLRPGGRILLNVPNYDQSLVDGPPHNVEPAQVQELYISHGCKVEHIHSTPGVIHGKATAAYNLFLITK